MSRKTLFALLCIFILSACTTPKPATPVAVDQPAVETAVAAMLTETAPLVITEVYSEESVETPKYTIKVHKPLLSGDVETAAAFNALIDTQLQQTVQSFAAGTQENESWRAETMPEIGSELEIIYTVKHQDDQLISILFDHYFYVAGAAHPSSYFISFNFAIAERRALNLTDLFLPGSDALNRIATLCIADLQTREFGYDMGAEALPENYTNWTVQQDGLLISFSVGQVAAHAAGPQQVLLNWRLLSDLVNPQGVAGWAIAQ